MVRVFSELKAGNETTAPPEGAAVLKARPERGRTPSGGYAQSWPTYNSAQVVEKDQFQVLLSALCRGVEEPGKQSTGRPRLPWRDMIFAAVFKSYVTCSARRFMCDLKAAHEKGLVEHLPHYNSVLNAMASDSLTPLLQQIITETSLPLRCVETYFAVDSTGLSTCHRHAWYNRHKARFQKMRGWLKLHIMVGVDTHIITSAEVTGGRANDNPYFKGLVKHTAEHFEISEVSVDAAYLAAQNQLVVLMSGGVPYIAYRSNSTGDGWRAHSKFWNLMLDLYRNRRPEFMNHYYRRNNVETTFHMVKAKFGERLRSRCFRAQVNEVLCRVICHNVCVVIQTMHRLGVAPTFWAEAVLDADDRKATSPLRVEGGRERLAPALAAKSAMSLPTTGLRQPETGTVVSPNKLQMSLCFQPTPAATEILAHGEYQQSAPTRETSSSDRLPQAIKGQLRMF